MKDNTLKVFFALVRAGLWEDANLNLDVILNPKDKVDWEEVYQLAEEQSVIGVVLAGIEHSNVNPPQELLLQWIGEVQLLEQQNKAMNQFVARLVEKMRGTDIYTLLVKGQGIAQCYERPLWRSCGDVDLFLSEDNYNKAKKFLQPLATKVDYEGKYGKHLGMTIDSWVVELHGNLRCGLSARMDKVIDEAQCDVFYGCNVRSWMNKYSQIFLPGIDDDIIFIFTHFLKHYYKGGIGLRQICDWCRFLWIYKDTLNYGLLEKRIRKMGLLTEWKAFGTIAVEYLGMPADAMLLYSDNKHWRKKAERILTFIMSVGNMGHKRDNSYFEKYPYMVRKVCSMGVRCADFFSHARVFPLSSLRFFPNIVFHGIRNAARGE